jgi:HK97 family phage major capsid protein
MPDLDRFKGMTPEQLRDEHERLEAELRDLHYDERGELRKLTPAEHRVFQSKMLEFEHVQRALADHSKIRDGFNSGRGRRMETAYQGLDRSPWDSYVGDPLTMRGHEARDAALRVLEADGKHLDADQADRVAELIGDKDNEHRDQESYVARRTLLTQDPHYKRAWQELMTEGPLALLTAEEVQAVRRFKDFERMESRAMGEVTPSAGGFGIPVFIDPSIILTAQGSGNPFLEICKVAEVNTAFWKGVTSAGVSWTFQTEGATVADNSPTLAQPSVTVFMARGFLPFSIELGQDYPNFAAEMAGLLAAGYDELLVQKFSVGSGSGEPMGIITALDADTNDEVRLTTAGAFGDVDVYNVWKALPQRFRRNAAWMMSVGVNNGIRRMGTSSLSHAYTDNLVGGTIPKLFDRLIYESPYFPDFVNTTGSFNQVVVGDFSNYVIARRAGMNMELVPTLFDITNNRPTGQRGYFAWARVGGNVVNDLAFRLLNQT